MRIHTLKMSVSGCTQLLVQGGKNEQKNWKFHSFVLSYWWKLGCVLFWKGLNVRCILNTVCYITPKGLWWKFILIDVLNRSSFAISINNITFARECKTVVRKWKLLWGNTKLSNEERTFWCFIVCTYYSMINVFTIPLPFDQSCVFFFSVCFRGWRYLAGWLWEKVSPRCRCCLFTAVRNSAAPSTCGSTLEIWVSAELPHSVYENIIEF